MKRISMATRLALVLAAIPAPLTAHQAFLGHGHPHGIEALALSLAAAAVGALWWRGRRVS